MSSKVTNIDQFLSEKKLTALADRLVQEALDRTYGKEGGAKRDSPLFSRRRPGRLCSHCVGLPKDKHCGLCNGTDGPNRVCRVCYARGSSQLCKTCARNFFSSAQNTSCFHSLIPHTSVVQLPALTGMVNKHPRSLELEWHYLTQLLGFVAPNLLFMPDAEGAKIFYDLMFDCAAEMPNNGTGELLAFFLGRMHGHFCGTLRRWLEHGIASLCVVDHFVKLAPLAARFANAKLAEPISFAAYGMPAVRTWLEYALALRVARTAPDAAEKAMAASKTPGQIAHARYLTLCYGDYEYADEGDDEVLKDLDKIICVFLQRE